jgi:hypothetical protein
MLSDSEFINVNLNAVIRVRSCQPTLIHNEKNLLQVKYVCNKYVNLNSQHSVS